MNPVLFALGLAGLALTACALAASLRLRSPIGFCLAAYVIAVAEVVLLTLALSPGRLPGRRGAPAGRISMDLASARASQTAPDRDR
jgi:hypothetical protein